MKTKKFMLYLAIIFLIVISVSGFYCAEASFGRRTLDDVDFTSSTELSDDSIIESVQRLIYLYDSLIVRGIRIESYKGIVCISGVVNNLLVKEKAIKIIKTVEGVRGVIDFTILEPVVRRDRDIKDDIVVAFLKNPFVYAPGIYVQVLDGNVTLVGEAANPWEKEEIIRSVKGISGVVSVREERILNTKTDTPERMLADAVKGMFREDEYLFDDKLDICLQNGTVIVEGTVDTAFEMSRAVMKIASFGVRAIENRISIHDDRNGYQQRAAIYFSDPDIEKSILDAIYLDKRIDSHDLSILVEDGSVKIDGMVRDIYQKDFLQQDIMNVSGVRSIENLLTSEKGNRDDKAMLMDFQRLLETVPDLIGSDIKVECRGGEIILYGSTDSNINKLMAEEIAKKIEGIKGVINNVEIEERIEVASFSKKGMSDSINWSMDVDKEVFQIHVNRSGRVIIISGDAKDTKQKSRAEELLRLRSPKGFSIRNDIRVLPGH